MRAGPPATPLGERPLRVVHGRRGPNGTAGRKRTYLQLLLSPIPPTPKGALERSCTVSRGLASSSPPTIALTCWKDRFGSLAEKSFPTTTTRSSSSTTARSDETDALCARLAAGLPRVTGGSSTPASRWPRTSASSRRARRSSSSTTTTWRTHGCSRVTSRHCGRPGAERRGARVYDVGILACRLCWSCTTSPK